MDIYMECKRDNKFIALQAVITQWPDWKMIVDKTLLFPPIATPLSIQATRKGALNRARRTNVYPLRPKGSIAFGIQKGFCRSGDTVYLTMAATGFIIKKGVVAPITNHCRVVIPVAGLASLMQDGMHPYTAYQTLTGIDLQHEATLPLYELCTGKKEVPWIQSLVESVLKHPQFH